MGSLPCFILLRTPSLSPPSHAARYLCIFLERWQARQPVVVRGARSRMRWGPEVMQRATREQGSKRFRVDSTDTSLQVRGREGEGEGGQGDAARH